MTADRDNHPGAFARVAGSAALVAPLVFVLLVVGQGLQHPGYSHTALPISALAAWPNGWIQTLNFLVLGSGMFAFAAVLHRRIAHTRSGMAGPVLLAVCGLGLVLAAAFPWRRVDDSFSVPPGHLVGAALTFLGAGAGLMVISRRMTSDPRWRGVATFTLTSGVVVLVLFLVTMAFARAEGAPLHGWLGLLQRLTLVAWLQCMTVLSWRIVRASSVRRTAYP